jgi:hypothetical protein
VAALVDLIWADGTGNRHAILWVFVAFTRVSAEISLLDDISKPPFQVSNVAIALATVCR